MIAGTLEKPGRVSTDPRTTAMFKRGFHNVFVQNPQRFSYDKNMVGRASTLRHIPAREDRDVIEPFANRETLQRKAVENCPEGAVFAIGSRGDYFAASLGCILATRFRMRGCQGIVTDGGFRDRPEISALNTPTDHTHPSAPTNLTKHHAVTRNEAISCGGVSVFPVDVIVGDNERVVRLAAHPADEIADEAVEMTALEDYVSEIVRNGASTFGVYPPTDPKTKEEFAIWRQAKCR